MIPLPVVEICFLRICFEKDSITSGAKWIYPGFS
uniref:Uncharacterized protein n=1 Tax=Arundo donax TaxID=35708 RepID=A0A0A9EIP2_ARUDO